MLSLRPQSRFDPDSLQAPIQRRVLVSASAFTRDRTVLPGPKYEVSEAQQMPSHLPAIAETV